MKILTINVRGIPSGSSSELFSANVFQDYDAVVVDPEDLYDLFGRIDYYNRNKNILTPEFGRSLFVWNIKRQIQATGLLQRGGVVVCFMEPVVYCHYYDENEEQNVTNYDWLLSRKTINDELGGIIFGSGQTIDNMDSSHHFSEYLSTKPSWLAYVDIDVCKGWKILASAYGTHAVALTKRVGLGHIVLLPSYYDHQNGELLERCIVKLRGDKEITPQPSWAKAILVPGQEELISKITQINEKVSTLEKERETLIDADDKLERWKYLLYEKGKQHLEPVVRDALALLGCSVESEPDKGSDGAVTCDDGTALLEVVGSKSTIKIEKLDQLMRNIGNFFETKRSKVKGILVGNPFRDEPLDNRPPKDTQKQLFGTELIESAEQLSIAVLLTTDLYEVVSRILRGELSEKERQSLRERIFNGKGLVRLG